MKKTKLLTLVLAIAMLVAMIQIPSFATYDSSNPPILKNVTFMAGDTPVFELPEEGTSVYANVYFENRTEQSVSVILASYAEDALETLTVTNDSKVVMGYPTVSTSSIVVTENTTRIAAFIWSDMELVTPVTRSCVLSEESGNSRLADYEVTLTDNGVSKIFTGDINHDQKTVDVYVPTTDINNSGAIDLGTGEKSGGANGYTSTFSDINFATAIKTATFAATAEDENATVIANGTADFSTNQTISVTAENGISSTYTVAIHPIGVIINSNLDATKLRYVDTEITINDTSENAWKYEANKYTALASNRALTPAPVSTTGYWTYNANNIAIKDKWRYTKADYEATSVPASDALYYSRIYADLSKHENNEANHYIDVIANNLRTGSGTATEQAKLGYTYANTNSHKGLVAVSSKINTCITSFDFTMKEGTLDSGFIYGSGIADFAVKVHYDDTDFYRVTGRANYADSAFNGKTASLYTTFKINGFKIGEWHNLKMISKDMGSFVNGKKLVHTTYYIDGEYAGYAYSTDKYSSLWTKYVTDAPGFQAFNNAECNFAFDNYFTGYCYQ